jgi:hypothetical protein
MKGLSPTPVLHHPHPVPEKTDLRLSMLIDTASRVVVPVLLGALIVAALALLA